jgi:hypothetical protein
MVKMVEMAEMMEMVKKKRWTAAVRKQ